MILQKQVITYGMRLALYHYDLDNPGIKITLPRQRSFPHTIDKYKFIPGEYYFNITLSKNQFLFSAMNRVKRKRLPTVEHLIPVPKADSVIMIEIAPNNSNHKLHIFLSHEKIPTYRKF